MSPSDGPGRPAGRRGLVAALAFAAALSVTTELFDPKWADPWPAILFGWYLAFGVAVWASPFVSLRVVSIHLAAVFLALAGVEQWFLVSTGGLRAWAPEEGRTTSDFFVRPDSLLGYVPARGTSARSSRRAGERLLYEVTYRIGEDGFRLTPPPVVDPPEGSLLILGCSFAFGEGLDDAETLPWKLAERTDRRFLVRNLGFNGYGPHQTLALLESGRATAGLPDGRPVTAFYEALSDHVFRALGRRPWSRSTPRWVLDGSGEVVRAGSFGEIDPVLEKWITWRRVLGSERFVADPDLALVVAIVRKARDVLHARAPHARFEVLFWDEPDELSVRYRAALLSAGFAVLDVSRVLPGYPTDRRGWQIPGDGHPTAAANERLARALAERLAEPEQGGTRAP